MDTTNLDVLAAVCEGEWRKTLTATCMDIVRVLAKCSDGAFERVWRERVTSRLLLWGVLRHLRIRSNPLSPRVLPRLSKKAQAEFWYIFWYDAIKYNVKPADVNASVLVLDPKVAEQVYLRHRWLGSPAKGEMYTVHEYLQGKPQLALLAFVPLER